MERMRAMCLDDIGLLLLESFIEVYQSSKDYEKIGILGSNPHFIPQWDAARRFADHVRFLCANPLALAGRIVFECEADFALSSFSNDVMLSVFYIEGYAPHIIDAP